MDSNAVADRCPGRIGITHIDISHQRREKKRRSKIKKAEIGRNPELGLTGAAGRVAFSGERR
jgi:hypothetical protein